MPKILGVLLNPWHHVLASLTRIYLNDLQWVEKRGAIVNPDDQTREPAHSSYVQLHAIRYVK